MTAVDTTREFLERIRGYGSLAVALSGGVDSATLAKAAALALKERAVAVTAVSELLAAEEREAARTLAKVVGIRHVELEAHDLDDSRLAANDEERCYYCKRGRFSKLAAWAEQAGFRYAAEGSNTDDRQDYRPGMRALSELAPRIVSPFLAAGWDKARIRQQAKEWSLPIWDKPSAACLASRVAYGLALTPARLAAVETAENAVRSFVTGQLRVRCHGALARIEAEPAAFPELLAHREEIVRRLRAVGFTYVTIDLAGYRMGSTNEALEARGESSEEDDAIR